MKTVQVTEQNFEATIDSGIVLLDWWAGWCGPCRTFGPIFEAAAARHPDVVFGKVDIDSEPALADAFRIRAVPTLTVVRDGVVLASQSGVVPGDVLDEIIREVRALDMDAVRKTIEDQRAAETVDDPQLID